MVDGVHPTAAAPPRCPRCSLWRTPQGRAFPRMVCTSHPTRLSSLSAGFGCGGAARFGGVERAAGAGAVPRSRRTKGASPPQPCRVPRPWSVAR